MSTYHSSTGMRVRMCQLTSFPFMQWGFSRRRYSPLKYLDPAAAGLEAGECPDASSFCQFLLSEPHWMLAPAPTALPLSGSRVKGYCFSWVCFGAHKKQEKDGLAC